MQPSQLRQAVSERISLRQATLEDARTIAKHRRLMFRDMGYADEAALDAMMARFLPWLEKKIESRDYLAWLAVTTADFVVAGAGLWLMDWPPHMVGSSSRRGNILNVYTDPQFRRRGLAKRLMQTALDWCKNADSAKCRWGRANVGCPLGSHTAKKGIGCLIIVGTRLHVRRHLFTGKEVNHDDGLNLTWK